MPFPGAGLSVEPAFLGGGGEQYRLKSQKSWNLGAGCWISWSVFVESKLQDSGSDYLSLRWIDLQTFQPANCTLQCESWKLALRQERGDTNCNGCICRLAFSSHTSPHPFFFSWRGFVGRGLRHWVLLQSGTAELHAKGRCWLCSGNSWSLFPEPQPWATTRCPPWRAP